MTHSKTVTAILTARDNNFTSAMNGAVSSLKKLNSNASDIPRPSTVNGAMKVSVIKPQVSAKALKKSAVR